METTGQPFWLAAGPLNFEGALEQGLAVKRASTPRRQGWISRYHYSIAVRLPLRARANNRRHVVNVVEGRLAEAVQEPGPPDEGLVVLDRAACRQRIAKTAYLSTRGIVFEVDASVVSCPRKKEVTEPVYGALVEDVSAARGVGEGRIGDAFVGDEQPSGGVNLVDLVPSEHHQVSGERVVDTTVNSVEDRAYPGARTETCRLPSR